MNIVMPVKIVRPILSLLILSCCSVFTTLSPAAEKELIANGKDRFIRQCGICHGIDGAGAGAFSELLVVSPPDLTVLAKKNGGHFPFKKAYMIIDGRELPLAHGTGTMPIWGERYEHSVPNRNETIIAGRIFELMLFLESIQKE